MRVVVQRVTECNVTVDGKIVSEIGVGLLVLLGVEREDEESDVRYLSDKLCGLRIFSDEAGKMNRTVSDIGGEVLVVSQFTLCGDCRKGRRPAFTSAAHPSLAMPLYESFCQRLRGQGARVKTGVFAADMKVKLINDGPVTILLDSRKNF